MSANQTRRSYENPRSASYQHAVENRPVRFYDEERDERELIQRLIAGELTILKAFGRRKTMRYAQLCRELRETPTERILDECLRRLRIDGKIEWSDGVYPNLVRRIVPVEKVITECSTSSWVQRGSSVALSPSLKRKLTVKL